MFERTWAATFQSLALTVLGAVTGPALADPITYVYTGRYFDTTGSAAPVTRLAFSFTIDDSLVPANGTVQLQSNTPGSFFSFVFSDGAQTLTGDPNSTYGIYTTARLLFDTDQNRQIVGRWDVGASRAHGGPGGLTLDDAVRSVNDPDGAELVQDSAHSLGRYSVTLDNAPGTWAMTSSVPEPARWAMLVAGLAALGVVLRPTCAGGMRAGAWWRRSGCRSEPESPRGAARA